MHVCFICSGNICRSPYAEARFRFLVEAAGLGDAVSVSSAGTLGINGVGEDPRTAAKVEELGGSLDDFLSRGIDEEIVAESDLIVCMATSHFNELSFQYPEASSRIRLLRQDEDESSGADIPDPVTRGSDEYEAALRMIENALPALLDLVRNELDRRSSS